MEKQGKEIRIEEDGLWNVGQLARYLNMAQQTVYRMVCEKRIPYCKIGASVRFRRQEIDAWLDQNKNKLSSARRVS